MSRRLLLAIVALCCVVALAARPEGRPAVAQGGGVDTSGEYVAAVEFDVTEDGFGFENYTNDGNPTNLTPNEVIRIYGEGVCAYIDEEQCILTPAAEQWMNMVNEYIGGGHCEGMAVLSLIFESQAMAPVDFGANIVAQLPLAGNEPLQREIALWWAMQTTPAFQQHVMSWDKTPNEVLEMLVESFKNWSVETGYTISVRKPDFSGGHAIFPWAVEDRGNGIFWILVYDNNWPGINRAIEVDTNTNSWTYSLSTNPNEPEAVYVGDAETKTLILDPMAVRIQDQPCPICVEEAEQTEGPTKTPEANVPTAETDYNQIWMEGDGDLQIIDEEERRVGFFDGKMVNEIPGAQVIPLKKQGGVTPWNNNDEPVYNIPLGIAFQITIDGTRLKEATQTSLVMLGPGYYLGVDEINLEPGQQDTIVFASDGKTLSYSTQSSESPVIILGFDDAKNGVGYGFALAGVDLQNGVINVGFNFEEGWLGMSTDGSEAPATYGLAMNRVDDKAKTDITFATGDDGITLNPEDTVYIDFSAWTDAKSPLNLLIDRGSDDSIDEEIPLENAQ